MKLIGNFLSPYVDAGGWLGGMPNISQADITRVIAYTFANTVRPKLELAARCPWLSRLAARCEALPAFQRAPVPPPPVETLSRE
jgi:glutathione S-transferase